MNWDDGKLFLAIARSGQMLAAARQLGLNQATLSRRMAAMEKALGVNLLIRRTNGCTLTDEGQTLMEKLERVEAEFLQAQSELSPDSVDIAGTIRIGAPDGFGVAFLAPRLAALTKENPHLTVQLVPVPQAFSLSRREADIAVVVGRPEQGRLIAQKLTDYTLSLYASADYASRHDLPETTHDLAGHRLVGYVEDLIYSPALSYSTSFWPGWRSSIEISSATGQVEAVRAGAGIGVLHDFLALGSNDLVPVLPHLSITRSYWTVYHESLKGIARIKAATEFLASSVKAASGRFVRKA